MSSMLKVQNNMQKNRMEVEDIDCETMLDPLNKLAIEYANILITCGWLN